MGARAAAAVAAASANSDDKDRQRGKCARDRRRERDDEWYIARIAVNSLSLSAIRHVVVVVVVVVCRVGLVVSSCQVSVRLGASEEQRRQLFACATGREREGGGQRGRGSVARARRRVREREGQRERERAAYSRGRERRETERRWVTTPNTARAGSRSPNERRRSLGRALSSRAVTVCVLY